jgi:hypothetical protein
MPDTTLPMIDIGPFMRRHDRLSRSFFIVLLTASLLVSVAACWYGLRVLGSARAFPAPLWFAMLFYPFPIAFLMVVGWVTSRKRRMQPDGSLRMHPVDARATMRVARAGAVYSIGLSAIMLASQVASLQKVFQAPSLLNVLGAWFTWRAVPVATGILLIWFGNAWPLTPTSRGTDHRSVTQKRFNRTLGWIFVLHGVLFVLGGVILPRNPPVYSLGIGGTGASMMLCVIVWGLMLHRAMKIPGGPGHPDSALPLH